MNDSQPPAADAAMSASHAANPYRKVAIRLLLVLGIYLAVAYIAAPLAWIGYGRTHRAYEEIPHITYTSDDHPGDPINIALLGAETDLKRIMIKAGWFPADPITLESCLKIAAGTVLKRPYNDAPVSALFLDGRKQDLAFEKPVGNDPRRRHHVRFWKSKQVGEADRPTWSGSATYDERVGLSHTTGEITHHISGDVDAERNHLFRDLTATGDLIEPGSVNDFHKVRTGRNGGGDAWHTDGRLLTGTLRGS